MNITVAIEIFRRVVIGDVKIYMTATIVVGYSDTKSFGGFGQPRFFRGIGEVATSVVVVNERCDGFPVVGSAIDVLGAAVQVEEAPLQIAENNEIQQAVIVEVDLGGAGRSSAAADFTFESDTGPVFPIWQSPQMQVGGPSGTSPVAIGNHLRLSSAAIYRPDHCASCYGWGCLSSAVNFSSVAIKQAVWSHCVSMAAADSQSFDPAHQQHQAQFHRSKAEPQSEHRWAGLREICQQAPPRPVLPAH
jgi:hypothetical protein